MIFVSYARSDGEFVDKLSKDLEEKGHKVWLDKERIKPGEVWDDKINEALNSCPVMILVLSPDAMTSPHVGEEWKFFMGLGRAIIPVLRQDCQLHFRLAKLQHVDLRGYNNEALEELAERLGQILGPSVSG